MAKKMKSYLLLREEKKKFKVFFGVGIRAYTRLGAMLWDMGKLQVEIAEKKCLGRG